MSYKNKAMNEWRDKDVKAWVNSLGAFNAKQKKLICKGVDEIGCDGDSLESAETADELKDALDIPIILARKLHRQVTSFKNADNNDDDSDDDDDDDDSSSDQPKKKKKSKAKSKAKSKKSKKRKQQESSDDDDDSSDDDSSDDDDSDNDDNEEDVLARLIARNLQKKNKMNPSSTQNNSNNNSNNNNSNKSKLFSWGNNNSSNNNSGGNKFGGYNDSGDKFVVNIQGSNGKYIQIGTKCTKHTKVRQVKQYLAAQEGGDPSKMSLKFNGRNMDDNQNLGFYGIANSRNLITVSYKVVGGYLCYN